MQAAMANANLSKAPSQADIDVGRKVRFQRIVYGLSQADLGAALSVARQQIQKYENGTNRLRGDQIDTLSKLFKVPIQYFYEYDPERSGLPFVEQQQADDDMFRFVRSKAGKELNFAFLRIRDLEGKRQVAALVESLTRKDDNGS